MRNATEIITYFVKTSNFSRNYISVQQDNNIGKESDFYQNTYHVIGAKAISS